MQIKKLEANGKEIAVVSSSEVVIYDVQSALDLMATVRYETGCDRIVIDKSLINESFFDLKTGLAGEIVQKFINYQAKVAIVGDFSGYASKSLRDFIYESNSGNALFFMPSEQQAIEKLSMAK
ncbi:DUF4180 domain-containing protein [Paenibacillus macerans]|uniref:DUF4180 domain-containing protein n=1 Tax=Paenibacillus macerans TaxID=44252 RepID=UPI002040B6E0|nr:DUF4180 domain-containing protein [Paenibacillus macerans]MCM3701327.1 DUF4180 domain-containing protein [Paenibacillus macerans]